MRGRSRRRGASPRTRKRRSTLSGRDLSRYIVRYKGTVHSREYEQYQAVEIFPSFCPGHAVYFLSNLSTPPRPRKMEVFPLKAQPNQFLVYPHSFHTLFRRKNYWPLFSLYLVLNINFYAGKLIFASALFGEVTSVFKNYSTVRFNQEFTKSLQTCVMFIVYAM